MWGCFAFDFCVADIGEVSTWQRVEGSGDVRREARTSDGDESSTCSGTHVWDDGDYGGRGEELGSPSPWVGLVFLLFRSGYYH